MSIQQYGRKFPLLLQLRSPKGHVELLETVGKGNYGYVYKGRLLAAEQQQQVVAAVKVVFLKEDEIRETLLEMEILKACNHPNITRYLGCFIKGLDLWVSLRRNVVVVETVGIACIQSPTSSYIGLPYSIHVV